jgi:hypothetical protein
VHYLSAESGTFAACSQGQPCERRSYDAWGQPESAAWRLSRGYTGHEHLPEFGLINMNGRMSPPAGANAQPRPIRANDGFFAELQPVFVLPEQPANVHQPEWKCIRHRRCIFTLKGERACYFGRISKWGHKEYASCLHDAGMSGSCKKKDRTEEWWRAGGIAKRKQDTAFHGFIKTIIAIEQSFPSRTTVGSG